MAALLSAPLVLPFVIDRPTVVAPLVAAIDEAAILATITSLSTNFANRYHAHATGTNAANAIKAQWEGYAAGHEGVVVKDLDAHTARGQYDDSRHDPPRTDRHRRRPRGFDSLGLLRESHLHGARR